MAERRCVGSVRLAPRATIHLKYSARYPHAALVKELLLGGIEEIAIRAEPGPMTWNKKRFDIGPRERSGGERIQ